MLLHAAAVSPVAVLSVPLTALLLLLCPLLLLPPAGMLTCAQT
jgi:hypothetical protein